MPSARVNRLPRNQGFRKPYRASTDWPAGDSTYATKSAADCGCFGKASAPVGDLHVGVNAIVAAIAVAAAATTPDGIAAAAHHTPWAGVPFFALTALCTWMLYVTLTALPSALAAVDQAATAAATANPTGTGR